MLIMRYYLEKIKKSMMLASMQKIKTAGLTLNKDKCQFSCSKIVFLGHVIDADGISPDPHKTEAIQKLKTPTTATELQLGCGPRVTKKLYRN